MYIAPEISAVRQLHHNILKDNWIRYTLRDFLAVLADNIFEAYQNLNPAACIEIQCFHPELAGESEASIFGAELKLDDIRLAVAREHGFASFDEAFHHGHFRFDPLFEICVDMITEGNLEKLEEIIDDNPRIRTQKADFGHEAQLIHYIAMNGTELWRQVVPHNLPEITAMLIKYGAKPEAANNINFQNSDLIQLITNSAHLKNADMMSQILNIITPKIIDQS